MKLFAIIYTTIVVLAIFSNVQAQNATVNNPDLPKFQFLLTSKPEADRVQLCEVNKGFCQTNCGGPQKAPMNFCNSTTMGWGCGCSDKVPDLVGYEWPINREHCIGSGQACQAACPGTSDVSKCSQACFTEITQKCGTSAQPPAYYAVSDPSVVPTYAPPSNNNTTSPTNSVNNSTNNSTNTNGSNAENKKQSSASSINHLGNAAVALVIIASGMSLL
uniref:4Fe-4S ferredoxin-type domain-containing protein n=1 Tax=Anthurium amnicola TaxID=1678845 RepID=A0A1D1Z717_9ARAE